MTTCTKLNCFVYRSRDNMIHDIIKRWEFLHGSDSVISLFHLASETHEFSEQVCRAARHTRLPVWYRDGTDARPSSLQPVVRRYRAHLDGLARTLRRCVGGLGHLVVPHSRVVGSSSTELYARVWLDLNNVVLQRQRLEKYTKQHNNTTSNL